jgi:hypothetical protein
VKREQRQHKLDPIWEGPYEVKELEYPNLFIQRIGKRKREKVHLNQVKLFHSLLGNQDEVKNGVFWVVTPCGSCKNRRFGGTWRLLHQGDKNR